MRASWRWRSERVRSRSACAAAIPACAAAISACACDTPSECPVDFGLLQLFLAAVILDGRFCRCYRRIRLGNLRLVIVVLQFDQQVPFVHLLIVRDVYFADNAGNLRAERGKIAADVSVVGNLFRFAAFPGIPVSGNGNQDSESEQDDQDRRDVFLPAGSMSAEVRSALCLDVPASAPVLGTRRERGRRTLITLLFARNMARAEFLVAHPKRPRLLPAFSFAPDVPLPSPCNPYSRLAQAVDLTP